MTPPHREQDKLDKELFTINGTFFYRGTPIPGKREIERSLRVKTRGLAVQAKKKLLIELQGLEKQKGTLFFRDVAIEVLRIQGGKARSTSHMAELQIAHLSKYFEHMPIDQIDEASWEDYIVFARSLDSRRKLEHDRRHLIMVMRRAYEKGLIRRPLRFRKPDVSVKIGKVYSDDEIKQLLNAANAELHLQILMAFTMGMRKSEILGLSWERVDLGTAVVQLRAEDTKTRRGRTVPISPGVFARLNERAIAGHKKQSGPIFAGRYEKTISVHSNESAWAACKLRADVKGRFHDLRHSFLTRAFRQPINPALICDYAGLSMLVAERVYLHFSPDDKRAVANLVAEPEISTL